MKKILIIGVDGFIGNNLASHLKSKFKITGTAEGKQTSISNINIVSECDITSESSLKKILAGADILINCAGINTSKDEHLNNKINAEGVLNLLKFAEQRGIKEFIQLSTMQVYRLDKKKSYKENDAANPISYYGKSKLLGEEYCKEFREKTNMNILCLRLCSVYGPNQKNVSMIPKFIEQAKLGKNITIYGKGIGKWNLLYIDDFAEIIEKLIKTEYNGTINVSSDSFLSVLQIAKAIKKVYNNKIKIQQDNSKTEDSSNIKLDNSELKRLIGNYNFLPFEKSLKQMKEMSNK